MTTTQTPEVIKIMNPDKFSNNEFQKRLSKMSQSKEPSDENQKSSGFV